MRDNKFFKWVSATLQNDEESSDVELARYFMEEGKMTVEEAWFYVRQRQNARSNTHYKLKRYSK